VTGGPLCSDHIFYCPDHLGQLVSAGIAQLRRCRLAVPLVGTTVYGRLGFDVRTVNHAQAVLQADFPGPLDELRAALLAIRIADFELIKGGGGEAGSTQRLRRALTDLGWIKRNIVIRKTVDEIERAAISHEIDHVRRTDNGAVALEIEWNNKDPFFDRDLENFQRLHGEGAISVGAIVTRVREAFATAGLAVKVPAADGDLGREE